MNACRRCDHVRAKRRERDVQGYLGSAIPVGARPPASSGRGTFRDIQVARRESLQRCNVGRQCEELVGDRSVRARSSRSSSPGVSMIAVATSLGTTVDACRTWRMTRGAVELSDGACIRRPSCPIEKGRAAILNHSAADGTRLAALEIAQRIGAEVYATAGNEAKRALLAARRSLRDGLPKSRFRGRGRGANGFRERSENHLDAAASRFQERLSYFAFDVAAKHTDARSACRLCRSTGGRSRRWARRVTRGPEAPPAGPQRGLCDLTPAEGNDVLAELLADECCGRRSAPPGRRIRQSCSGNGAVVRAGWYVAESASPRKPSTSPDCPSRPAMYPTPATA